MVLANPSSGRGRARSHLDLLRRRAADLGTTLELSEDAADLTRRARRAVDRGVERLLVAGGDGTINYAMQELVGSHCALAILPLGSANDLAGALEIAPELDRALETAVAAPVRPIDLGRAGGRFYAGVACVGLDSEANRFANERVKHLRGGALYAYSVARTIASFKALAIRFEHDTGCFEGPAMIAAIGNSPRYGGGLHIAPHASLDDGLLDVVIVKSVSRLRFLAAFPKVQHGTHLSHPAVVTFRTRHALLSCGRESPMFADGEHIATAGAAPIEITIEPKALLVVAPCVS